MTEQNDSRKREPSLRLTEDPSEGQGRIQWNGNYGKYLAQRLNTLAMDRSRSTTSNQISLIELVRLLSKSMETTGTGMNRSAKQCQECKDLIGMDGE